MKRKEVEKSVDRHIRIWDIECLERIDKIMRYPEYKSFNKVINDALFIGLPKILERLAGQEEITLSGKNPTPYYPKPQAETTDNELLEVIIKLLKETVMNAVINKSILSSLFHAKEYDNNGLHVDNELFTNGLMSDTPEFLEKFETEHLKKMRQER